MDAGAGSGSWNGVGSSYHEDSKKSKWLLDFAQIARELTMKLHLGVTSGVGIHVTWMFVFWCLLICLVGDFVLRIRSHGTKITMKTLPFGWMFVNFSNHRRETNLGLIFWGGRKWQWPNLIFEDEDRVGWWWMFFFLSGMMMELGNCLKKDVFLCISPSAEWDCIKSWRVVNKRRPKLAIKNNPGSPPFCWMVLNQKDSNGFSR